ncbi:hypothetical protein Tco_0938980 [Tanacetum coccineum]|uniref:Reverse transcriptase zinc-binding domain-containing protein n=1 Tax=Tanacetum coccineum TaxID=301880 RepID=A0ABQ5DJC1_9ASTR
MGLILIWTGNQPLKSKSLRLFTLEMEKDVYVAHKFEQGMNLSSFRWHPKRGAETEQWEAIQKIITSTFLSPMEDCWVWSLDGMRMFYVALVRILIDKTLLITSEEATIWCKLTHINVNILTWRLSLDKLPTRLNLSARGLDVPSVICPIYSER